MCIQHETNYFLSHMMVISCVSEWERKEFVYYVKKSQWSSIQFELLKFCCCVRKVNSSSEQLFTCTRIERMSSEEKLQEQQPPRVKNYNYSLLVVVVFHLCVPLPSFSACLPFFTYEIRRDVVNKSKHTLLCLSFFWDLKKFQFLI